MAQDITLWGASYSDVPAVDLPKTTSGTARFTDVTATTAVDSDVLQGKYFFTANGVLTLGTNAGGSGDGYVWQDAQGYVHLSDEEGTQPIYDTLNVSGSGTFTPSQGHAYNSVVVASGTAGTPSASKGTVSNHAVTVTPSVTNSTGWITGSTKTGTGVSVSASELVSGTYSVTSSGTKDVTNYASASVPSGSVTAPSTISGTSASVSTGTNTLTLTKTVSVTPSVTTAGYVSSGTAGNASVSLTASVNTRSSSDLSASGDTVTVPSGYYANSASKAVAAGSAGTPTATKGTVSNHSISVTPSVTNTAGYISGGTKTGTAVTVTASELASGNKSITENGTNIDVVGFSTVSVAVSGGGGSSNLVTGSFTTGATRDSKDGRFTINYSGSGFPVALIVCADNGTSTGVPAWTASVSNYDIGYIAIYKRTGSEPSYTTAADADNLGIVTYCYRYNASTVNSNGQINVASYVGSEYTPSYATHAVKFVGSGTNAGYCVGGGTSNSLGLSPSTTYSYIAIYSE